MSEDAVHQALEAGGEVVELVPLLETLEGSPPIKALGFAEGPAFFFLDGAGQICRLGSRGFTSNGILGLFLGDARWLETNFKIDKNRRDGKPEWDLSSASGFLMRACRSAGPFRLDRDVRGPGVWPDCDDDGADAVAAGADGIGPGVVVHLGTQLFRLAYQDNGQGGVKSTVVIEDAGQRIGRWVYPSYAPEPGPDMTASVGPDAAEAVAKILGTCSWRNPDIDARLLLGAIGVGLMVGVAPYRPPVWLVAPTLTGKSAVIKILRRIYAGAEQYWDDTTAPKIRDDLGAAARPVIVDEFEAKEQGQREKDIVELSRNTYDRTAGSFGRSGTEAKSGQVSASFVFASVDPPPVLPQDENRRAVLHLVPVKRAAKDKVRFEDKLRSLAGMGAKLRRRMLAHWGRFDQVFTIYRQALFDGGHDARGADTFGTLLACADLLTADANPDADSAAEWAAHLDADRLAMLTDTVSAAEECWSHLVGTMVEKWEGGDRVTVGRLLGEVLFENQTDARKALARRGLAIRYYDGEAYVCVAGKQHPGIKEIFRPTRWAGGGWTTALRSPPIDGRASTNAITYDGIKARSTIIPAKDLVQAPDAAEDEATQNRSEEEARKRKAEAALANKEYVPGPDEPGGPAF